MAEQKPHKPQQTPGAQAPEVRQSKPPEQQRPDQKKPMQPMLDEEDDFPMPVPGGPIF